MQVVSNTSPLTNLAAIQRIDLLRQLFGTQREGRHLAMRYRLSVMGVVGILIQAKRQKLVGQVLPELDNLRTRAGFYPSRAVYLQVGRLVGEG